MRSTMVLLTLLLLVFSSPALAAPGEVITGGESLAGKTLSIVVFKADRRLEVRDGDTVLRRYAAGLGFAPAGDKEKQGDGKTPEGSFSIVRRIPKSSYYKAFLIDYPDPDDAERGVKDGIISASTAQKIRAAHADGKVPPQYSDLGGLIEIHGMGGTSDWTLGCVAVDNSAIDALWPHIQVGTKVIIKP